MRLDIEDAVKRFGGLTAVDGVNLSAPDGTIVGLIGPNGAGKTTLVQMITGYCRVDSGRISLNGIDISSKPPHQISRLGIARTFQNIRMFPEMTVAENVAMGTLRNSGGLRRPDTMLRGWTRPAAGRKLAGAEHLELLGAAPLATRLAGTLSYGDQRRVEIARALATKPGVLLLDEPAAGMSSKEADALGGYIRAVAASGITVLLIEHNVKLVRTVCERICVMDQGRRLAWGTPDEIMADTSVIDAYLGAH